MSYSHAIKDRQWIIYDQKLPCLNMIYFTVLTRKKVWKFRKYIPYDCQWSLPLLIHIIFEPYSNPLEWKKKTIDQSICYFPFRTRTEIGIQLLKWPSGQCKVFNSLQMAGNSITIWPYDCMDTQTIILYSSNNRHGFVKDEQDVT